jgi:catechol-2,3-dioxygenase
LTTIKYLSYFYRDFIDLPHLPDNQAEVTIMFKSKTLLPLAQAQRENHGYEAQSKLWKKFPLQAAYFYTLRFAG